MGWLTTLLLFVFVFIAIVAGVFLTMANTELTNHRENQALSDAYWYSFTGAILTWVAIGGVFIFFILGLFNVIPVFASPGPPVLKETYVEGENGQDGYYIRTLVPDESGKDQKGSLTRWVIPSLIAALILVTLTGILAALTADRISSSDIRGRDSNIDKAYDSAVLAASLSLGSVGILLIAGMVYEINDYLDERKKKQEQALQQAAFQQGVSVAETTAKYGVAPPVAAPPPPGMQRTFSGATVEPTNFRTFTTVGPAPPPLSLPPPPALVLPSRVKIE